MMTGWGKWAVMLWLSLAAVPAVPAARGQDAQAVELELWTWALRPWFDDYCQRMVADFEAKHPGVSVTWVDVPGDAMRRKMFSAGAAGALPDVINFSDQDFARFASLGALRPLGDILPGDSDARYVAGGLDACRIDGELFALPWYLSTPVRLVNAELLAAGGLSAGELGETWDDLIPLAGPFREATGAYLFTLRIGTESELPGLMLADGLELLVPHEAGGLRGNLTDPAIVASVAKWVELYRAGAVPRESATGGYAAMVQAYQDGRAALINANAARRIRDQAASIYEATEVMPALVGELGRSHIAVTVVGVSAQTEHPELAAKLAWHVTSPQWQTELALLASRLPATIESLADERFTATGDKVERATALSAGQLPEARAFTPAIGSWPDLRAAFEEGVKRMLLDGRDVAAGLAEVNREWDRILRADAAGLPYN